MTPLFPFDPFKLMLKPHRDPYGYKNLLVYKKAEELQAECRKLTGRFPKTKTMVDLANQMDRSARSVKQNIVEGWKRNSTDEYHTFLGFSIAANAELEEDCKDIWNGVYPELENIKGIMGEEGRRGLKLNGLRFYPLDKTLPPVVQLYLRCRELNLLIEKLQKSLVQKMSKEHTMSARDKFAMRGQRIQKENEWLDKQLEEQGFVRLENGKWISPSAHKQFFGKKGEEGKRGNNGGG